jgi:tetratricopeptide (TPR) repeat protein
LGNLASTYRELGQPDEALPLQQRAVEITEAALGSDHPDTAIRLNNLASTYRELGQPDEALPLQQRVAEITEAL